jgi:tripartite-type tricarboxylate transporter receptor subunit TctC
MTELSITNDSTPAQLVVGDELLFNDLRKRLRNDALFADLLRLVIALFLLFPFARAMAADVYPSRPIHLIVPYSPGGNADIQGRYVAQRLTEGLGKQVIVDNRPGANSIIGTGFAAHAPADGYTILLVASAHAVNPSLASKLPYDPLKDLQPISLVGSTPLIFVAHAALPPNNVKELIALAKSRPGELNFGSSGSGSPAHLAGALFNLMARIKLVNVSYKGMAQATTDVIAGQIELAFPSMTSVLPHVKSGKLKAYAITAAKRSPIAPELPTMSEAGVPGYEASIWNGLLAPSGTPKPIVARLNQAVVQALNTPEAREHYAAMGADVLYDSPAEFDAFIRSEMTKWAKVIRESGIRVELAQ